MRRAGKMLRRAAMPRLAGGTQENPPFRSGFCFAFLAAAVCGGCASTPREAPVAARASAVDPVPGFLRQFAETNRFRSGRPNSFVLSPDGKTVFFLRSGPRDRVQALHAYDVGVASGGGGGGGGAERVLLTAETLLGGGDEGELSPEEKARRERTRQTARGIASFELSKDGKRMLVPLAGRLFVREMESGVVKELKPSAQGADALASPLAPPPPPPPPLDPRFSPDGTKVAFVRGGELWVVDVESGKETKLTSGASDTVSFGEAEFVAQEEMGRTKGYWWSPGSKWIAFQRTDVSQVEQVFISDPLNPFKPAQSWRYPRAGTNNAEVTLWAAPVDGSMSSPVELKWDRVEFPYLATVKWERQRGPYVLVQNRLQSDQQLLLFSADAESAAGSAWSSQLILSETDPAWLNLDQDFPAFIENVPGFVWSTEGAGWVDYEWRMEGPGFSERRLIAGGELNVRSLVKADFARREVLVTASPEPQGPTQTHLFRLAFQQGELVPQCLTCEWPGVHDAKVSSDGSTLVLTTTPETGGFTARVFTRGEGEGGLGREVGAIASKAEAPMVTPSVEWTTVGGLKTGDPLWHAALVRPRSFRAGQKYPVLCSVYTGPTSQTVLRTGVSFALDQWAAEHGFIVVRIDNRGTPGRGRAWERLTHRNLIDLQLNDQAAALKLLGEKHPELDLSRVGVYGWSFGGYYAAMAACRRPDVYHAACAGAPVADWADYDTHYTERYLGVPEENKDGYRIGNVMTWVKDLRVPMLLIHGSADDNVYFTHSLKIMESALREGTSGWIDFVPLAGQTHVVVEPTVVERMYGRMMGFFAERLGAR
ncbi:MAG: DPP IV N-terminal domain-containing protein [Phycisphaerales bacterium]